MCSLEIKDIEHLKALSFLEKTLPEDLYTGEELESPKEEVITVVQPEQTGIVSGITSGISSGVQTVSSGISSVTSGVISVVTGGKSEAPTPVVQPEPVVESENQVAQNDSEKDAKSAFSFLSILTGTIENRSKKNKARSNGRNQVKVDTAPAILSEEKTQKRREMELAWTIIGGRLSDLESLSVRCHLKKIKVKGLFFAVFLFQLQKLWMK